MEANLFKQNRISTLTSAHRKLIKHKPKHSPSIVSVLRKPSDTEETRKTVYKDSWFDLLLINHLSKSVQAATGSHFIPFFLFVVEIDSSQREVLDFDYILCRT